MRPVVSVLMLTYNHERYIEEAVRSVLNQQTDFDFEIVVGEDNSTDRTFEKLTLLAEANKNKIRIIRQSSNIGSAANFYQTFMACKGKYIAFLEGDDFWINKHKLQKQVDFLERNPDYGLVHGEVNHLYQATGRIVESFNRTNNIQVPQDDLFESLLKPNTHFIKTMTVCLRKDLVERHFDFQLAIKEQWPLTDLPLWLDIARHSKIHYFDEVMATYRLLDESASRTKSYEKMYQFHKANFRIKELYLKKYKCPDSIVKDIKEDYYRTMIADAYNIGNVNLAQASMRFLKASELKISLREHIMFLGVKYSIVKKIVKVLRH